MPVAEIFLAAFVAFLFDKLGSELLSYARQEGIHTHLKKWSQTLLMIQAVMADAEDKQITDRAIKLWLEYLRDLAYDLDDLLDEIATHALRQKLDGCHLRPSKVWNFIPTCSNFTPGAIKSNNRIMGKIKEITARLDDILERKINLNLIERGHAMSNTLVKRLPSTSVVNDSHTFGREKEKEQLIELLLRDEGTEVDVCIIPLVGMGGIGKTTLAQLVYNDSKVEKGFDVKAWVCVSEEFDVFTITKTIFESVTMSSGESKDLNLLQVSLKEILSKKRFFIVLDDVWNKDYEKWDLLSRPLEVGLPGSKLIVTTRDISVASMVSSFPPYHMKELTNKECLSILARHALGRKTFDEHTQLQRIGEKLAEKCKGLPLAAKTLGGLLRSKTNLEYWTDVLNSKIWDLPKESNILPVLRLSYHHLDPQLKQLFAYCSIFPKDYEFDKYELVLLWMGEGFLRQKDARKEMEELGFEYFNELYSRSLFQSLDDSRFVMHDLINDLAQFVAGGTCYRLDEKVGTGEQYRVSINVRHASFIRHEYEVFGKFKTFYDVKGLRTFLPMPIQNSQVWPPFYLSNRVLLDLLPQLHCLRVLSLSGYSISELPSSISKLIHLRYLNLSGTSIVSLPESLTDLKNLQTLLIRNCRFINMLPETIGNLIGLHHLDNANTDKLEELPVGVGQLTSLQTLSKITVSKYCGMGLRELKDLQLLQRTLTISGLQNVSNIQQAKEANMLHKQYLEELHLVWSNDNVDSRDEVLEGGVLDMLQPHRKLRKLKIDSYLGRKFPGWIGDRSFLELTDISLNGCAKCTSLPPLGQLPKLKHLRVGGMLRVKNVGIEFLGGAYDQDIPFSSLETLRFNRMPEWEEWSLSMEGSFPRLRDLAIFKCPKLKKVSPLRFPVIQEIDLEECSRVVLDSFVDLNSLTYLKIENVAGLSHLSNELIDLVSVLEVLEICNCGELLKLWEGGAISDSLLHLRRLVVADCVHFASLGDDNQGLPCNIEILELICCTNLKSLPQLSNLGSLRELIIKYCPALANIPENGFPPMLKRLEILGCTALESFPYGVSNLERLEIKDCSSLRKAWPDSRFPTTLKKLAIRKCELLEPISPDMFVQNKGLSLEEISIWNWPNSRTLLSCMNQLHCLVELSISHCDSLESFPEDCFFMPNLRTLCIEQCSSLKSLPPQIQSFMSLKLLEVRSCQRLQGFPNSGLPPSITLLRIWDSRKLKPLTEWGLHKLSSLQELCICGGFPKLDLFDDDEHLFPSKLTKLVMARFSNLRSLSKGLQRLTSLQHLSIMNCRKLLVLPEEDLLDRLWHLEISDCPLLKHRCSRDNVYWPKIAGIPCVEIDGRNIFKHTSDEA